MQWIENPEATFYTSKHDGNSNTNQKITEKPCHTVMTFRMMLIDISTHVCGSYKALFFHHFPPAFIYFLWLLTHQIAAEQQFSLIFAFNNFVVLKQKQYIVL